MKGNNMIQPKKITVCSLKGGVGKSSVVAQLGLALQRKGFKVGFQDIDITGSSLFSALGLATSPKWDLDTRNKKIVVPQVNGYWLLSIASYTGEENVVLWELNHYDMLAEIKNSLVKAKENSDLSLLEGIINKISDILASSKWHFVEELLNEDVVTWPPLDYLLVDMPPSTSSELLSFFRKIKGLSGTIIIAQPSIISTTGLMRTIDFLRINRVPILGIVANQDGYINKYGELEYQFLSPSVDLKKIAKEAGIPLLFSIPQCGNEGTIQPFFEKLADIVMSANPVILKDVTIAKKIKRKFVKGIARLIY